jgi:hypothetical protein
MLEQHMPAVVLAAVTTMQLQHKELQQALAAPAEQQQYLLLLVASAQASVALQVWRGFLMSCDCTQQAHSCT